MWQNYGCSAATMNGLARYWLATGRAAVDDAAITTPEGVKWSDHTN
jgi:hypothetical protein